MPIDHMLPHAAPWTAWSLYWWLVVWHFTMKVWGAQRRLRNQISAKVTWANTSNMTRIRCKFKREKLAQTTEHIAGAEKLLPNRIKQMNTKSLEFICRTKWLLLISTHAYSNYYKNSSFTRHCSAKYARKRRRSLCASQMLFMLAHQLLLLVISMGESSPTINIYYKELIEFRRQFYDLIEIFRIGGYAPNTNYLFLGMTIVSPSSILLNFSKATMWTVACSALKQYHCWRV